MRRIYVRLKPTQVDTPVRLAKAERRHPSDQAALLLEQVLPPAASAGPSTNPEPEVEVPVS